MKRLCAAVACLLLAGCVTVPASSTCNGGGEPGGPAPAPEGQSSGTIRVEAAPARPAEDQRVLELKEISDPARCAHTTWLLEQASLGPFEERTTIAWSTGFSRGLNGDWETSHGVETGAWGPRTGSISVRAGDDTWAFTFMAQAA